MSSGARCRVRLTTFQWIPDDIDTKIEFNTKDWDINNEFNNGIFTAKEEGYYTIMANAGLLTGVQTFIALSIYKNTAFLFNHYEDSAIGTDIGTINIFNTLHLEIGDTLQVYFHHKAGQQKILIGIPASYMTCFSVNKI